MNDNPQKTKRIVMMASGAIDAVIGAGILLVGLGFFPVDIADFGISEWVALLVGGGMFLVGAWMAIHNYLRLDE